VTDHRGDPADGIDPVDGSPRPAGRRRAELVGDPRRDPLFPNRDVHRAPVIEISGQIPVVRVGVVDDVPAERNGDWGHDAPTSGASSPPLTIPYEDDAPPEDDVRHEDDASHEGDASNEDDASNEGDASREVSAASDAPPTQRVILAPPPERAPGFVPPPAPPVSRLSSPTPTRSRPARATSPSPARVRRAKPRVRRVRRVLRSVDTWTVFKVSAIFYLVAYIIVLIAGVLLWNLANSTGTVDNVERFFESFGWDSFEFKGGELFHAYWIIGLFMVVAATGLNVTLSVLFNLIADLVGGIGLTVLEEEVRVVRVDDSARRADNDTDDEPFDVAMWNDITGSTPRPDVN